MVMQLKRDGSMVDLGDKPGLDKLQAAVGGYIEPVRLNPETGYGLMYANEEGLLQGLDINPAASVMARTMIVGDVVLLTNAEVAADEEG